MQAHKILEELWTENSPSGAYWNPTRIVSDNRIPALGTDSSAYTFVAPAEGAAAIGVKLIFRRAYIELADQKDWDAPDIVMGEVEIMLKSSVQLPSSVWLSSAHATRAVSQDGNSCPSDA
jgi:hypothetical protein